jgi:hypothetical protein
VAKAYLRNSRLGIFAVPDAAERTMKRAVIIYIVLLALFVLVVYLTVEWGQHSLQSNSSSAAPAAVGLPRSNLLVGSPSVWSALGENIKTPLSRLLLQFIVILSATRALGTLFKRFGQPAVIGEMAAGILLGPSLLGWLWPEGFTFVFPKDSLGSLQLLSQIGVCLFMFVVGMELEVSQLRQKARTAFVVSQASIIFPYFLGVMLAVWLYPSYAHGNVSFVAFALFMGIALSITAFPVLVRILEEKGITKSFLGVTATACAAVDDASAWSILAFVVAIARSVGFASTALCVGLLVLFVASMLCVMRPRLPHWLGAEQMNNGEPGRAAMTAVLVFMTLPRSPRKPWGYMPCLVHSLLA